MFLAAGRAAVDGERLREPRMMPGDGAEDDAGTLELGDDVGRPVHGDEGEDEGGMGVGDEAPLPPISLVI